MPRESLVRARYAAAAPSAVVLRRGQEVSWQLENAPAQPGVVRAGRSQIGPDGTIEVGVYGTCSVLNLNEREAARVIETLLAGQMKNPRVTVRRLP